MAVLGVLVADDADQPPEFLVARRRAAFLPQQVQGNDPFVLLAAMLAGQLVHAAFQRLPQPEIIAVQGQHLAADTALNTQSERLMRISDMRPESVCRRMFQLSISPKPEVISSPPVLMLVLMRGAVQAVEGGDQLLVGAAVVVAVRGNQQVVGLDVQRAVRLDGRRSSWR